MRSGGWKSCVQKLRVEATSHVDFVPSWGRKHRQSWNKSKVGQAVALVISKANISNPLLKHW